MGIITGFQQAQFITTAPKQRKTSDSSVEAQQTQSPPKRIHQDPPLAAPMQASLQASIQTLGNGDVINPHLIKVGTKYGSSQVLSSGPPTSNPQYRPPLQKAMHGANVPLPMLPEGRMSTLVSRPSLDYPSPGTPSTDHILHTETSGSNQALPGMAPMLPPLRGAPSSGASTHVFKGNGDIGLSAEHRSKRMRRSTSNELDVQAHVPQASRYEPESSASVFSSDVQSPGQSMLTPCSPYGSLVDTPLTPGSPTTSDDNAVKMGSKASSSYGPTASRRLSVNSLLSGPPGSGDSLVNLDNLASQGPFSDDADGLITYGFDEGNPDRDMPHNDDKNAISVHSPTISARSRSFPSIDSSEEDSGASENNAGLLTKEVVFTRRGYYAHPVPIRIPQSLEPLPSQLLDNPMNLLYFHHFLNHTARILVPHDCQANPFRNILPLSKVGEISLLSFLTITQWRSQILICSISYLPTLQVIELGC